MGKTRLPEPKDTDFDTAPPARQGIRRPNTCLSGPEGQGRLMETADDGRQRRVKWEIPVIMKQKLSPNLQAIYDLELALGNAVVRVNDNAPLPLIVVFKEPLHRAQIESAAKTEPPVKWYSVGAFAGYVSEDTGQSLQGPTPALAGATQEVRKKLAPNLQAIYDLELSQGNSVIRVDEPAGDRCPLAVIFKNPLQKAKIESTLSLPPTVRWWECRDPHYPIEGGYGCCETGHAIAGPLR